MNYIKTLIESTLSEAPLPDDWDKNVYSSRNTFKNRVEYAKQRAEQIGVGSSRIAFIIDYQGRKTVLKIAKNRKGMMQNYEEARILSDGYMQGNSSVIPIIDYDETNSYPTWIHTEYADKIKQSQLKNHFGGVSLEDIMRYLACQAGMIRGYCPDIPDDIHENETFQDLHDMVMNFNINPMDFTRKANWGLYKGTPVVIDIGFTEDVNKTYYTKGNF